MRAAGKEGSGGRTLLLRVERPAPLLEFLLGALPSRSRSEIKSYLTHGRVSVEGRVTTRFDEPLHAGDCVSVGPARQGGVLRHPLLRVVHADDYLVVVEKGAGLLSMASAKERERTAYRILSDWVKRADARNRIFIVHRLDRETSGLMLFARSEAVQHALQQRWRELVLDRRYVAVVEGRLPAEQGSVCAPLAENRNCKVYVTRGEGLDARTDYRVLRSGERGSLVELTLATGRKNQIRAHMEWMGCPVAGDRKYGSQRSDAGRVCLHALRLAFVHPVTGEELNFSTSIPRLFVELI